MSDIRASNLDGVTRGNTASRPVFGNEGDLYVNTQTGFVEVYSTSFGWEQVGAIASTVAGVTATNVGTGRAYNNGAASVSFTPGTVLGRNYLVTSSPGGYTASGSSSPVIVEGLQSSTQYTYTVVASNNYGTAAISAASAGVTATTVPQAPSIVATSEESQKSTITITPGATGGSAITEYTIISNPVTTTQTTSNTVYEFTGLTNEVSYTFTATATNANGISASSATSNTITPSEIIYAFEKIGTYSASGSTVSITGIPDTYRHLVLAGHSADNRNVAYSGINIIFNEDTGSNYWSSYLSGDNRANTTSVGSWGNTYSTSLGFNNMGGPTSSSAYTMFSLMNIFDYADTTKLTTINHKNGWGDAANTSYVIRSTHQREQGFWNNTNKVSSITITTPFGPFRNTEWVLYGIKD